MRGEKHMFRGAQARDSSSGVWVRNEEPPVGATFSLSSPSLGLVSGLSYRARSIRVEFLPLKSFRYKKLSKHRQKCAQQGTTARRVRIAASVS